MQRDELIDAKDAALLLEVSAETVRRWSRNGKLTHVRLPSGRVKYRREDILALLAPVEPDVPVGADGGDAALDVPFPALVGM